MTGAEVLAARATLSLSAEELAGLVGVSGARTIYKWEHGDRAVPGPVAIIITAVLESAAMREYFGVSLSVI